MNKVNMSLDEIINNTRKNKRKLEVVKGDSMRFRSQRGGFRGRRNLNFRNEDRTRGRPMRGRGGPRATQDGRPESRGFRNYRRYNNIGQRETNFDKVHLIYPESFDQYE